MKAILAGMLLCLGVLSGSLALADDQIPDCMGHGQVLGINNEQVLNWKTTTANSYLNRAHIKGTLQKIFPDMTGHHHFEVRIGQRADDVVEVIYNEDFGGIPDVHIGTVVEACGDYITSNSQAGPYPPSPDGAIVHWVHMSPNPDRHDSGFLVLDGDLCGTDAGDAGPKNYPPHNHHRH